MNREFTVPQIERYDVRRLDEIDTPRLLLFDWALQSNRERLATMAAGLANVRMMAKTVKASAVFEEYRRAGMTSIKASCVSEARAIATGTGFGDILIALPLFGPAAEDFLALRKEFPGKRFPLVVANAACAEGLSARADGEIEVYLDVDPGMKRTGVAFGRPTRQLAERIEDLPHLKLSGLHVYDGNVHHDNPHAVRAYAAALMAKIDQTVRALGGEATIREVVTGSSLTSPPHAEAYRAGGYAWRHTVSPGTATLWDSNYNDIMPGAFDYAAAVATRVLDVRPHRGGHLVTTDCGVKLGVSTELGLAHVLGVNGYRAYGRSERFGMLSWLGRDRATGEPVAEGLTEAVGRALLVFPRHICTTVNQYAWALMVRDGEVAERVEIDARDG